MSEQKISKNAENNEIENTKNGKHNANITARPASFEFCDRVSITALLPLHTSFHNL